MKHFISEYKSKFIVVGILALIILSLFPIFYITGFAARLPTIGGDSGNWGTVLNEFLQAEHTSTGGHKNVTVNGSLTVYNSSNSTQTFFIVNGSTGNINITGTVNASSFNLGIETKTGTCNTNDCVAIATCSSGKLVLFGRTSYNSMSCTSTPSTCNADWCPPGLSSCSVLEIGTNNQASVYIICAKIN